MADKTENRGAEDGSGEEGSAMAGAAPADVPRADGDSEQPEAAEASAGDMSGALTDDKAEDSTAQADPAPRPRRRIWRRVVLSLLALCLVLALALALAVVWLLDRPVAAPQWLRHQVEQRAEAALPGTDLRFGEMRITVSRDWRPSLRVRDLELRAPGGAPLLSLTRLEGSMAMRPLLRGEVQPKRISASGARAVLRREPDGSFRLAFGDAIQPVGEAASLAQLIETIDQFLVKPQLAALVSVKLDALTLRYEDALAGRAWSADGGRISLDRQGDDLALRGDVALLGGHDYATVLDLNYDSRIGSAEARFGVNFEEIAAADIAAEVPPLAWLEVLRAPISGSLRSSIDGTGALGPLSGTIQIGAGVLQPTDSTRPVPFDGARSYFTYDPNNKTVSFDELSLQSKWVSAKAEGTARLLGMETGLPSAMLGQFNLSDISFNPADLYPQVLRLDGAEMDARLTLDPFTLELGQLSITDRGRVLHFDGRLDAAAEGWKLALDGRAPSLDAERVRQLWPEALASKTRAWVADNLHAADLRDVEFALRIAPNTPPDSYLGFRFEKARMGYLKTLPDITDASGHASLLDNRFTATLSAGQTLAATGGSMDVAGTSFVVPDTRIKGGTPAQVLVRARSSISALLSLLNEKPFEYMDKAGRPVDLAQGRAVMEGQIDLALKKKLSPDEVRFAARASLFDVESAQIVPDRVLRAAQAQVTVNNQELRIAGAGRIGQVPFTGKWETALGDNPAGQSRVTGEVTLSRDFVEEFNIGLPDNSVAGQAPANMVIDLARGQAPRFALSSRLAGLSLRLDPLDWALPARTTGNLKIEGTLGTPPAIDSLVLDAPGLSAEGKVSLNARGQLDRATFSRVRSGNWLDVPVTLRGRGDAAPAIEVTGGRIDLRQTSIGAGTGNGTGGRAGGPITVALDRLQISEGIALTGFRGQFISSGGMNGQFSGRVDGGPPVKGTVVPEGGRSAFRITSAKAGEVLAAAGLLEKAHRGDMELVLRPRGAAGQYNGVLRIKNVWLRNAPAMAGLLSAVSVVGLLEQLSGDGLLFSDVEAKFRLTPRQVVVTESSAIGASMGISMDGYYDLESDRMDMQGVFSPLYLINGIGAVLTRKGEGLIGFNYTLKGTSEQPRVQVNPLSIFTPGMFREIFRRPAPRLGPDGKVIATPVSPPPSGQSARDSR